MHGIVEDSITSASTVFDEARGRAGGRAARRQKAVRLVDIARAANVSIATVSMVLSDNPRISSATQQRVRRIVQRMGYQPLHAAQVLAGRRSNGIAVLVPQLRPLDGRRSYDESNMAAMLDGVCEQAAAMGYTVQLERVTEDFVRRAGHLALLNSRTAGGLLLIGFRKEERFINDFDAENHAVVIAGQQLADADIQVVGEDARSLAMRACRRLIERINEVHAAEAPQRLPAAVACLHQGPRPAIDGEGRLTQADT